MEMGTVHHSLYHHACMVDVNFGISDWKPDYIENSLRMKKCETFIRSFAFFVITVVD